MWKLSNHFFCSSIISFSVSPKPALALGILVTSIHPGVLSLKVVFVNKFNLMEDILLLVLWPVREGLDLISCRCM